MNKPADGDRVIVVLVDDKEHHGTVDWVGAAQFAVELDDGWPRQLILFTEAWRFERQHQKSGGSQ